MNEVLKLNLALGHVVLDDLVHPLDILMVFIENFVRIKTHLEFTQSFKCTPQSRIKNEGLVVEFNGFLSLCLSLKYVTQEEKASCSIRNLILISVLLLKWLSLVAVKETILCFR